MEGQITGAVDGNGLPSTAIFSGPTGGPVGRRGGVIARGTRTLPTWRFKSLSTAPKPSANASP